MYCPPAALPGFRTGVLFTSNTMLTIYYQPISAAKKSNAAAVDVAAFPLEIQAQRMILPFFHARIILDDLWKRCTSCQVGENQLYFLRLAGIDGWPGSDNRMISPFPRLVRLVRFLLDWDDLQSSFPNPGRYNDRVALRRMAFIFIPINNQCWSGFELANT